MTSAPDANPLYYKLDSDGNIIATSREPISPEMLASGQWQCAPVSNAQLHHHLYPDQSSVELLASTDAGLVRVIEDLVDVLINRGVIQFTDLPEVAQAKLLERRESRVSSGHRLFISPEPGSDAGLL